MHTLDTVTLPTRAASARALAEGFCQGTPLRHELAARGDLETLTRAVGDELTRALGPGVVEGVVTAHVVDASPA